MRAKTIECKHIMDDNASGYYDQHIYITHRIANKVVRNIIRQRIRNSVIFIKIRQYSPNFVSQHKN